MLAWRCASRRLVLLDNPFLLGPSPVPPLRHLSVVARQVAKRQHLPPLDLLPRRIVKNRSGLAPTVLIRPNIAFTLKPAQGDPLLRDVVLYIVCLHELRHAHGHGDSDDAADVTWRGGHGLDAIVRKGRLRHQPLQVPSSRGNAKVDENWY
jgi:hypothetical protein